MRQPPGSARPELLHAHLRSPGCSTQTNPSGLPSRSTKHRRNQTGGPLDARDAGRTRRKESPGSAGIASPTPQAADQGWRLADRGAACQSLVSGPADSGGRVPNPRTKADQALPAPVQGPDWSTCRDGGKACGLVEGNCGGSVMGRRGGGGCVAHQSTGNTPINLVRSGRRALRRGVRGSSVAALPTRNCGCRLTWGDDPPHAPGRCITLVDLRPICRACRGARVNSQKIQALRKPT